MSLPPYDPSADGKPEIQRHKYGAYGWVRLSDDEYSRLLDDLGEEEFLRLRHLSGRIGPVQWKQKQVEGLESHGPQV